MRANFAMASLGVVQRDLLPLPVGAVPREFLDGQLVAARARNQKRRDLRRRFLDYWLEVGIVSLNEMGCAPNVAPCGAISELQHQALRALIGHYAAA